MLQWGFRNAAFVILVGFSDPFPRLDRRTSSELSFLGFQSSRKRRRVNIYQNQSCILLASLISSRY